MKNKVLQLGDWMEGKLKSFCGEITPDKRLIIIMIVLLLGVITNLYLTFSSVYNIGHENAQKEFMEEVEHIKQLQLESSTLNSKDNLNLESNDE